MRSSVMEWMRSLACFYLLLSAMLHLMPQKKYEQYIRFFMGLLLIWMLCTPLFTLLGKAEDFLTDFQMHYQSSMEKLDEEDAVRMQSLYLQEGSSLFSQEQQGVQQEPQQGVQQEPQQEQRDRQEPQVQTEE